MKILNIGKIKQKKFNEVNSRSESMNIKICIDEITTVDADRLANSLLRNADKMFQNPEVQAEFKKWQQKRQKKRA